MDAYGHGKHDGGASLQFLDHDRMLGEGGQGGYGDLWTVLVDPIP